ncbi:acyl carrier protein [Hydrogeniiclostridium mannosilyticum]|uniref:acyl carrier protein n=1 Tax=Hydrogeniiclostridium mannosilyticum TaxID=2764322 RepID=UPI00399AB5F8
MNLHDEVKNTIIHSLNLNILPADIGNDVPLFEGGIGLDSIDGLELLVAVERAFDIEIDDSDLGGDVLKNVNSLVSFIEAKRKEN